MKNPKETMQEYIRCYDKKGNYATLIYGTKIETAISIYEEQVQFLESNINVMNSDFLRIRERIKELKREIKRGKRSLE